MAYPHTWVNGSGQAIDAVALEEIEAEIDTKATLAALAAKIDKATLDPNSVLYAIADDTPAALAMAASTILARLASGNIVAATPTQLKTLLAIGQSDVSGLSASLALLAPLASPAFTGAPTAPDPSTAQGVATKAYVDAVASGLDVKASVRAATTANITLSGAQTIDGVSVVAGDRVLVKDQTTGSQNGIYVAAAGAWARAADADASAEVTSGMFAFTTAGTANGLAGWVLTTADPITLGTTALAFSQFSAAVPSSLTVKDEGSALATAATSLDFVGAGVTATGTGAAKIITIPGASAVSQGAVPDALTGAPTLAGWWKADAITGKVDGDTMTTWNDSSSAAQNLTASGTPIYKAAASLPWGNGKPAVRFDASSWFSKASSGLASGSAFTAAAVVFRTGAVNVNGVVFSGNGTGNFDLYYESNSYLLRTATGPVSAIAGVNTMRGVDLLVAIYDGAQLHLYINGVPVIYVAGAGAITPSNLVVGSLTTGGFYQWTGDIFEVAFYTAALTAAQRDQLTRGLAYKYALPVVPPF